MEKRPSFERVIGGTERQKKQIEKQADKASSKSGYELYGEQLISPTPEEKSAIEQAVSYANIITKNYGAKRTFTTERIFLLKPGGVKASTEGAQKNGVCNSFNQSIAIDQSPSNCLLSSTVLHELLHMNSYHSSQVIEKKSWWRTKTDSRAYRRGISMLGREGEGGYFSLAEEAIIATLSKRFFDEIVLQNSLYEEEMDRTKAIKEWLTDYAQKNIPEPKNREELLAAITDILILPKNEKVFDVLFSSDTDVTHKFAYFVGYYKDELKSGKILHERAAEREEFNKVLDRIVKESNGKITDRNQLFDLFAHAHFSGNYIPLARTVEDILGKGSFREIAKELGDTKDEVE